MALEILGQVGPQTNTDGDKPILRAGRRGELVVQQLSPAYAEAVARGNLYYAATPATGVAPGTAIGTTAAISLWNPSGSAKNLVIVQAALAYISGTLGAGAIHWCVNPASASPTAPTSGTLLTTVNALTSSSNTSTGIARSGSTLSAGPTLFRVFGSLTALLASTATTPYALVDRVDGAIVVGPGSCVSLQATAAAGSTPLVVYTLTWEEVTA